MHAKVGKVALPGNRHPPQFPEIAGERLQQAQCMELVGQLTGGIAHDFNNLLTIILGNAEQLLATCTDAAARQAAERVASAAERAATLTAQLLAFSQRQPLHPKPTNPALLLAAMSDTLHRTVGEDVHVRTTLAGNWACEVDAHQLESAILNLALNARDAMPGGGTLSLDVSNTRLHDELLGKDHVSGDCVVIALGDTGNGMPEEVLEHACEPFFTTKPVGHGTGLGLSQVYGFVRQSGGWITLASEPGHGTVIHIFLRRCAKSGVPTEAAAACTPPGGNETILLTEDERGVRQYCGQLLRGLGYRVLAAGDGETALQLLSAHPEVGLLLTDVGLPGLHGGELAKRAVAMRPGLPVLFASGYPRQILQRRDQLPPGTELLSKPYTRIQLAARVRALIHAQQPPSAPATKSTSVLLLEDDAALRTTIAQLLGSFGLPVDAAGSLAEARALLAAGRAPDLALVDINLGGETGMDALEDLRAANRKVRIIITSGYGDSVRNDQRIAADPSLAILPKPYTLRALKRSIVSLGFTLRATGQATQKV